MQSAGTESAFKDTALNRELMQCVLNHGGVKCEALGYFALGERAVRACIAANEFEHRLRHGSINATGRPGGSGIPSASR